MHRIVSFLAAFALTVSLADMALAAQCKDASGKFVKCPAASATAASAAPASSAYTLDAKGKCRDAKGKMAKMSLCGGAAATTSATGSAAPAAASTTTNKTTQAAAAGSAAGHPQCKKGKPCGDSCIAMDKVCHKQ